MPRFNKGLNKDVDPSIQPEGTYRHMVNGIFSENLGVIEEENTTSILNQTGRNIDVIGYLTISEKDYVILFEVNIDNNIATIRKVNLSTGQFSIILRDKGNTTFSPQITVNGDLNFQQNGYIDATYSVDTDGDVILYWTDGVNPPRFLNISSTIGVIDIKETSLFPKYDSKVDFTLNDIGSGSLKGGSYYLTFAYIDKDNTLTDYFYVSQPIHIVGPNGRGVDSDTNTNKAIDFTLSGIDTTYQKVRVSAIKETDVSNIIDIPIRGSSLSYVYTGNEGDTVGSIDEIVVDNPIYSKANSLYQYKSSLYLGGLEKDTLSKEENISLQKTALNTEVSLYEEDTFFDNLYKFPINEFNKKGFKLGEVYALYMSFILESGKETKAFHIPGRTTVPVTNQKSRATIDILDTNFPPGVNTEQQFLINTGGLPENGSLSYAGFKYDDGYDGLSDSTIANGHTLRVRFKDNSTNGGSNLFTNTSPNYAEFNISGGTTISSATNTIVSTLNTLLANNGLDNEWEAKQNHNGFNNFAIVAKNAGSSYDGYHVEVATNIPGGAHRWFGTTGNSSGTIEDVDETTNLSAWATDTTEFGTSNTVYGGQVNIEFSRDSGSVTDTININSTNINNYSWGPEGPWMGGDTEVEVAKKFVALLNDSNNTSNGNSYETEFTNIQNDYSFSHPGNGSVTITANSIGSFYDGSGSITDSQNNIVNNNFVYEGGYDPNVDPVVVDTDIDGDGFEESRISIFQSDSNEDIANKIFNDLDSITDLNYSINGSTITIEENDFNGDFVGITPQVNFIEPYSTSIEILSTFITSFTSPITGTSGNGEKDLITGSDVGSGSLNYQIYSGKDSTYNLGYWENQNEQYPDKKPFNTVADDESISYANQNVRHHRIPDYNEFNSSGDQRKAQWGNNKIWIKGFTINNVQVEPQLRDKVVGYKIYYAEKDSSNKLIMGQSSINNGWLDTGDTSDDGENSNSTNESSRSIDDANSTANEGFRPYQGYTDNIDKIFNTDIYCTHGFDELAEIPTGLTTGVTLSDNDSDNWDGLEWGSKKDVGYCRPPDLLLTRENISNVTHVKGLYRAENDFGSGLKHKYAQNAVGPYSMDADNIDPISSGDQEEIVEVNAISYIDKNQRNINLKNFGFNHDMDNLFGESKIIMEFDSNFTKRGFRTVGDLCQTLTDVHVPYDNQKLIDTGIQGNIDSNGNGSTENVLNGDIYICNNYYKANTLLLIYTFFDLDNPNWNEDYSNVIGNHILDNLRFELFENDDPNNSGGDTENEATFNGILNSIGDTSELESIPVPISHLYEEWIESRINTNYLYSGSSNFEQLATLNNTIDWGTRPNLDEISSFLVGDGSGNNDEELTEISRWCDYYKRSDNYPKYNEEYTSYQDRKTTFPWSVDDRTFANNYNRIIQSAGDKDGRSESFRRFLENDFFDVNRNRGSIINLEEVNNNLIIHLERSLIQTRGRDSLDTTGGERVFIGSGNIFSVQPDELITTEIGFGGLQDNRSQIKCEDGYFWYDRQAKSIFHMLSNNQLKELTGEEYGLKTYFDNNLDTLSSKNVLFGYDKSNRRVMITFNELSKTFSFYPLGQFWVSEHNYLPDLYIQSLTDLITIKKDSNENTNIFIHDDNTFEIYNTSNSRVLEVTFAIPHGIHHKVHSLWFNADKYNNGSIINEIPFNKIRISNTTQDTGNITLEPYVSIENRGNTRKTQGLWRINDLRVEEPNFNLPSWANQKRLEDDYHIVKLMFDNTSDEFDSIQLKSAGLDTVPTIK